MTKTIKELYDEVTKDDFDRLKAQKDAIVKKQMTLAERRLKEVQEAIASYMNQEIPLKRMEVDHLAEIVDPSPMKRGGRKAFIKKHKWWEDEE